MRSSSVIRDVTEKGEIITDHSRLQRFSGNRENISPYISFVGIINSKVIAR